MSKDTVRRVDYWYATVPDQPGAGNVVLQKLAAAKVNLIAYLAFPVAGGKSQIDLIPVDGPALTKAAQAGGIALSARKTALLVQGSDRVGALGDHVAKLAAKGVNAVAGAAVATAGGGYGFVLWVKPVDLDKATAALSA